MIRGGRATRCTSFGPRVPSALERRTPRRQLVDSLRAEIASEELGAGTALVESELNQRFQVSRGTAREALRE
ncbi:GntR family transcriptional regulator [Amycolatopsis sp. FDAARGOS 1241]|nr:GntR family transcriptional regulator [Amycolatopsis sp. FDAARGOS 1241]